MKLQVIKEGGKTKILLDDKEIQDIVKRLDIHIRAGEADTAVIEFIPSAIEGEFYGFVNKAKED